VLDGRDVVKNDARTVGLILAGLLAGAQAQAQVPPPSPPPEPAPAPAAPPPPAPAAPAPPAPPPVEFGVAPAALPSAPVGATTPVPTVSWGAPPGADTTTAPAEEKPQSPFYFTRFAWGNQMSTQLFGIGGENHQSPDAPYTMSFTLNARYYYLNRPLDKAYVNFNIGFETEVTDTASTSTTTSREPLLNDIALSTGYGHTVYQSTDKEWKTTPGLSVGFVLPTSKLSYDQGKYLTTSINANLIQILPLAGKKSDWFAGLLAYGTVGYAHTFSRCTTPCASGAQENIPRQVVGTSGGDLASVDVRSDQLSGGRLAIDKVKLNLTYFLDIYKDLSFANTWEISFPFKGDLGGGAVNNISTGPMTVGSSTAPLNPVTTFDVSLAYLLFDTVRIDIGYQSISPELLDNAGQRVSVFWTPASVFYGNVNLYIDTLLDKAMNPPTKKQAQALGRFHAAN
jgi:hypothetical protein